MSIEEYKELRESIVALSHNKVTHVYNKIFGQDHIQEIDLQVTTETVTVIIPEKNSRKFFAVLKKHLGNFGVLSRGGLNLPALFKWKAAFKTFGDDIAKVFR